MDQSSFFNAADECLAPYIGDDIFDESLLLNVLFQERLLVHEAYFFNSSHILRHVATAREQPSLLELASQRGLIIPAFRDPNTSCLEEAYELMRKDSVYGTWLEPVNPELLEVKELQPLRDRLIGSVNEGLREGTRPFYWPSEEQLGESLGDGYCKLIRQWLQTEEPPEHVAHDIGREQLFQRVWEVSKRWRYECVDEAVRRTMQKGAKGLQRTELVVALGRLIGMPSGWGAQDVEDLPSHCQNEEEALAMEVFLKWITQCHHVNMARAFNTSIHFPVYNLDSDFILDSLLRSPLDPSPPLSLGFRCDVELPPFHELIQTGSVELVAIRKDLGVGYLAALRRWQENPSEDNREYVKASLTDYCERICTMYNRMVRQPFVASFGQGSPRLQRWGTVAGAGVGLVQDPGIGLFVTISKLVNTVYQFIRGMRIHNSLAPTEHELEITMPHR
jgi:hypothetical protein